MPSKKMGRPTDNPRPHKITTRISEEERIILEEISNQESVSQTEAVRMGIGLLKKLIKK